MSAAIKQINIEQGAYWSLNILWKDSGGDPVDITGYTARMQIRSKVSSPDAQVEITDGDGITLGDVDGTIFLELTADQTGDLVPNSRNVPLVYDLLMTPPAADPIRLIQGKAALSLAVTR